MGGCGIAELCGIYLLNNLTNQDGPFEKLCVGLHRDDGLGIAKTLTKQETKLGNKLKQFSRKKG